MAPHAEDVQVPEATRNGNKVTVAPEKTVQSSKGEQTNEEAPKTPLELKGVLDQFKSFDVTPIIGREYSNVDLSEWLRAPNSDELLRDLAITSKSRRISFTYSSRHTDVHLVSQRGVVFFRAQDGLNDDLQKELAQRLGELSGKPSTSKLHIHPVSNSERDNGGDDNEISIISSVQAKKIYKGLTIDPSSKKQSGKDGWHSDITFEPVPSDYAILRLTELPGTGGGTYLDL